MTAAEGMAVLRHPFQELAPSGVIRVGVLDAGLYARSYAGGAGTLDELRPGRPTRRRWTSRLSFRVPERDVIAVGGALRCPNDTTPAGRVRR
jgi:hypothetical protein